MEERKSQGSGQMGKNLGLHLSQLYHCSPAASLCLCLIRYVEQTKQQPSQSTMSVPPTPKTVSLVLLPHLLGRWRRAQMEGVLYVHEHSVPSCGRPLE